MKTNVKHFRNYEYIYNPKLQAGYYDPLAGWHLLKFEGVLYYNYDSLGVLFFNKI